jgi:hypothetical protein
VSTITRLIFVGWLVMTRLECVSGGNPKNPGYGLMVPEGIKPIQLVRKPEHAQGQLEITDEGMAVLQNLTSPFAMVSAVGPTRCVCARKVCAARAH